METKPKKENLHAGHRERMRKKFLKSGFTCFSEHEVLEFMLFYVYRRRNTNELSHMLINRFGSLENVLKAHRSELLSVDGVGECCVTFLNSLWGLLHYFHMNPTEKGVCMKDADARCEFFRSRLMLEQNETVMIAYLDDSYCVEHDAVIARGTPGDVHICLQSLMRDILNMHCNVVMLAHNHPKGTTMASSDDIRLTREIGGLCQKLGIGLADHVIVADGKAISMIEEGLYTENMH